MSKSYILSIDQGTSGTKAIIFNEKGELIQKHTSPLNSYYPKSGFVEQNPQEILNSVYEAVAACIAEFRTAYSEEEHKIISCGISNQRETFVIWDENGEPLYNAVVWQCKRSVHVCEVLKSEKLEEIIHLKTGLTIDPYFSASKVTWLYNHDEKIRAAIGAGKAYFGTIDTWLIYKLTHGASYKTDYTNASRTLFFNIYDLKWDDELLQAFNVSNLKLPEVTFCSDHFGDTNFNGLFNYELPITGVIGDSQAAFFGEGCFDSGMAKATLGTGSSILWNVKDIESELTSEMITTIGWSIDNRLSYAVEGIIVSCGATLEWLKQQLGVFESNNDIEKIATEIEHNDGVYLIPAFSGMGAPYWEKDWKASIHGLTFNTTKSHLVRAGLESIAFQLKDVISDIENKTQSSLKELKVNGGITANAFLMQFIADVLQTPIVNMGISDVSAWGAAAMAGLGGKLWNSLEGIPQASSHLIMEYFPNNQNTTVKSDYKGWLDILSYKNALI